MSPISARNILRPLLFVAAAYYALWGGEYSAFDLQRLKQKQTDTATRLVTARAEVDSLRAVAGRLDSDAPTIERVARERFGMIKDGEVLYRFVEVEPGAVVPEPQPGAP
jgi:cell division protein FtsB